MSKTNAITLAWAEEKRKNIIFRKTQELINYLPSHIQKWNLYLRIPISRITGK
jgi:hypothetical protein